MCKQHRHFEGKSAFEHLKSAREKGAQATAENHGTEAPGSFAAAIDAGKDVAVVTAGLAILLHFFDKTHLYPLLLMLGGMLAIWKTCRSSMLGWTRLERLHRLIEQERWEIEHHRETEKEELIEMYKLKGFSGKLLDDAVEVMMADDNRLLGVMLEEELGLKLHSYEHPLRQACGALIGALVGLGVTLLGTIFGIAGIFSSIAIFTIVVGALLGKRQGNDAIKSAIWTFTTALFTLGILYFTCELIHGK